MSDLKELLNKNVESEDLRKQINDAITALINKKVGEKETAFKELEEKFNKTSEELKPFKQQKRSESVKELLTKNKVDYNEKSFNTIMRLTEFSDEDDETSMLEKVKGTIQSDELFQKPKEVDKTLIQNGGGSGTGEKSITPKTENTRKFV